MSIIYKGVRNGGLSLDENGNISTTRVLVYYFNGSESAVSVSAQSQIPAQGTAHPDNASISLRSYSISEPMEGDGLVSGKYEVTLNYTRTTTRDERDKSVEPWRRRPYDVSIPSSVVVAPFQKAYQPGDSKGNPSKPVLNAAGDPFEDSKEEYRKGIRFSFNLRDFPASWVDQFSGTINRSAIQVCDIAIPAKHGRLKTLFPSRVDEYKSDGTLEYTFWKVDVEIETADTEYKREIMERGLFALKTGGDLTSKYRIYIDDTGAMGKHDDLDEEQNPIPVDEPQRLNANGTLYTADLTGAVYAEFDDLFAADWRALSLPKTVR